MRLTTPPAELPLGTSPQWEGMHRKIRTVCYVLLFGLVIEGALTFPLLALWYGVPKLTPIEECSELQKVMYNDTTRKCETQPLNAPPLGGPPEAQGQTTAQDTWGIQPKPQYGTIHFRELIKNMEEREAKAKADAEAKANADASSDSSSSG